MARLAKLLIVQVIVLSSLVVYQLNILSTDERTNLKIIDAPMLELNCTIKADRFISQDIERSISTEGGFGACLLVQDDNHLLAEWLAYHLHVLPLRRLIIGIDPRSTTSPSKILNRYRMGGLMKISEWHEQDMMPPHLIAAHQTVNESVFEDLKAVYITRQIEFYTRCMATLKFENFTWTAITDTDEYILLNSKVKPNFAYETTENRTIFEVLNDAKNRKKSKMIQSGCVSMHRLQFGDTESNSSTVQNKVPKGFNGYDLTTMRWRYHTSRSNSKVNKLAKCLVDLKSASFNDFISTEVSPHRPLKRLCEIENMWKLNKESPIVVHHYSGSWEQWNYRNDFRPKRRRESFDLLHFDDEENQDDSIRGWLQEFVDHYGIKTAGSLLENAGRLDPK